MHRLLSVIRKELIQIRRDPLTFGLVVLAPLVMLLLYGYAVNFDLRHIPIVVCDQDRTPESRDFLAQFPADYFRIVSVTAEARVFDRALDAGRARVALWIPSGFGAKVAAGRPVQVYAGLDGADANTANVAQGYLNGVVQSYSARIIRDRLQRAGLAGRVSSAPLAISTRVWYNEELKSSNFIVPGLCGILLMMLTTLLTAMAVTGEKERNTFEQLAASPIHPAELIIGKILPYALVSSLGVILVVTLGRGIFGVPLRGSLVTLAVFSGLFLLTALGLGLLISTAAKTQQAAMFLAMTLTILPTILLSGFIFPINNMPPVVRYIAYAVPARYFIVALRGIFLKGVGFGVLWPQAAALAAFAIVVIILAATRFRKRLE